MLTRIVCKPLLLFVFGGVSIAFGAETDSRSVDVDEKKVAAWNRFAGEMKQLHFVLIKRNKVEVERGEGGYRGEYFDRPDFFTEEVYRDATSGKVVSRVKWEKDNPENVHVMELFVYDDQHRVSRDYLVAYLPWGRNAPIQALVNLHSYNNGLHSFRQFDASGVLVYEQCQGNFGGNVVEIALEPHEMVLPMTARKDYLACFEALPIRAGQYLQPQ